MTAQAVRVGIAVVEHRGRYLVGRRQPPSPLAGKAEFPGGKCEPDETQEQAAIRECREETGLSVKAVRCLYERHFDYPHGTVDLQFWLCTPAQENVSDNHNGYRWLTARELMTEDFPDANRPLLELLALRESS